MAAADGKSAPERELSEAEREALERRHDALAQIRKFGDPVLKSRAAPVSEFGDELQREVARMIEVMRGAMGIGLAATQLGAMRRLLVFQAGADAEPQGLVNPQLDWASDDLVIAEEGCLSLPKVTVDVERPLHVRITGSDPGGEPMVLEAAGLEARVLQLEIDHLDGLLITDRTDRTQRRAALRALRAGEPFSPELLEPPEEGEVGEAVAASAEEGQA